MKHPFFAPMGKDYPIHLEAQYDRILSKIEELWHTPMINDYFSDLLIDKRGGRQGFPAEVAKDLILLREYHELETFRAAERKEDAIQQLAARGLLPSRDGFLQVFREGDQALVDLYVRAQLPLPADDNGEPLLLAALKRGHTVVAKIVMEAGAEVNARDAIGLTPLLVACGKTTHGYRMIAEGLIKRGANINVRDPLGFTPLLLAISGGMFDIAHLLLDHGANTLLTTRKGESALQLAERHTSPDGEALRARLAGSRDLQLMPGK